jgi:hypothetical protein
MEPFIQAAPEIDVNAVMAAVEKQIQERKDAGLLKQSDIDEIVDMELQPLPDFQDIPNVYEPVLYPGFEASVAPAPPAAESFGEKGPAKAALKALRRLLEPWRRFMNRPVYLELKNEIAGLRRLAVQSSEYVRLLHNALHNLVVESTKMKTDEEMLKTRLRVLEDRIEFLENRQRALERRLPGE